MVDADWERAPAPPSGGLETRVAAIVPFPEALGGAGEVLALEAFGSVKLPSAEARAGESLHRAVSRAVVQMAGVPATPERLLYIVEQTGKQVILCFLCSLDADAEPDPRPGVRFVPVSAANGEFEPPAVRELLVEDVRGGFVRPVAFARVTLDEFGRNHIDVSW